MPLSEASVGAVNAAGYSNPGKNSFLAKVKRQKILLLMLLPCVVWVVMFCYAPLWGWYLAFVYYRPGRPILNAPWVGLDNFRRFLFTSYDFARVIRNTLVVNIASLAISMPLEISLAIVIYELRFRKFKRVVQTISYLPYFISWVILGGIFFQFLSMNGVINNLLVSIGLVQEPILFLGLPSASWPILISTRIWKNIGYSTIIYLGAMGAIDPGLYEAAYVDGAGRWKRIWHVTLPALIPTISVLLILAAGSLINGAFDQVYVFQNTANMETCDTIDTMVFRTGIAQGNFSYATSVGIFNSFCSITLLTITNTVVRRLNGRSLL
jgi:putative aldouronate transport system permease protein